MSRERQKASPLHPLTLVLDLLKHDSAFPLGCQTLPSPLGGDKAARVNNGKPDSKLPFFIAC